MQYLNKTSELSEQQIQKKITTQLEKDGYLVLKIIKCNKSGYPDLIAVKENDTLFVEVKRPKGKLSELQKVRIADMKQRGINVVVWTAYKQDFK